MITVSFVKSELLSGALGRDQLAQRFRPEVPAQIFQRSLSDTAATVTAAAAGTEQAGARSNPGTGSGPLNQR